MFESTQTIVRAYEVVIGLNVRSPIDFQTYRKEFACLITGQMKNL